MKDFLFYYSIAIASLILFLYGFFPVQHNHTLDPVSLPISLNDIKLNKSYLYRQEVDRIILIIIDALRLDFINEENVPFIISSYQNKGCILTVKVQSPTVTLPRIKALTTGDVPQFVDVIFNLASTESLKDSFLHKVNEAGKKIVFYGDDTWIKLYPSIFTRYEGVSSFYVNDYTEVDQNVTRNLIKELNNKDWHVMLLHYLGLDHIGHVYGPYSNLIQPKLKEMDNIVKKIFYLLNTSDGQTLIIITGDHGMKDSGGHGGSTFSETHVPFVSIGIPCVNDTIAQTDIPSTLASLFGIAHPANSIGRVISNMLISLSYERILYILRYNAMFLKARLNQCKDLFEKASILHHNFLKTANESHAIAAKQLYEDCSKQISDALVNSSVEQDIYSLLIGSGILIITLFVILYNFMLPTNNVNTFTTKVFLIFILILEVTIPKLSILRTLYLVIISGFGLYYVIHILRIRWKPNCNVNSCVIIASAIHSFSLFSSSFIEEEHQIWYFFFSTFLMLNCYITLNTTKALQWVLLFLALRIIRNINQTGDKWAHLPDLSQWLLLDENYSCMHALYFISLILVFFCCISLLRRQKWAVILNGTIILLMYILNMYSTIQNMFLVRTIWFLILLNLLFAFLQKHRYLEHIIVMWTLFSVLLMRPYNVILLPFCIFTSSEVCKQIKDVNVLTVIHIWLGRTLFFCQGHSNSLASVDVASGYIGIQEYVPLFVIMQVLGHTYTFPVLTSLLVLKSNLHHQETIWIVSILCRLLVLIIICIITLIHQHHLFIWTVFAPKLLIESCHTAVLFIEIITYYCITIVQNMFINILNKVT